MLLSFPEHQKHTITQTNRLLRGAAAGGMMLRMGSLLPLLIFVSAINTMDEVCAVVQRDVRLGTCFAHREEIDSPLTVVQKLYRSSVGSKPAKKDWGVRAHFEKFLQEHWHEVRLFLSVNKMS
jgi:hypothetical protein